MIVGVLVVLFARSEQPGRRGGDPDARATTGTRPYGIYVCDPFLPTLTDAVTDTTGHPHPRRRHHPHPPVQQRLGRARTPTLAKWGETIGLEFTSDGFTVPDGTEYKDGYDCNGQPADGRRSTSGTPTTSTADADRSYTDRLRRASASTDDRMAFTLAVVPEGTDVPPPAERARARSARPTSPAPRPTTTTAADRDDHRPTTTDRADRRPPPPRRRAPQ